jgi:hypothetical protein
MIIKSFVETFALYNQKVIFVKEQLCLYNMYFYIWYWQGKNKQWNLYSMYPPKEL